MPTKIQIDEEMKTIFALAALLLALSFPSQQRHGLAAESFTTIQDSLEVKILNPAFSGQRTLKVQLANGLQAYLISDPAAELSGASLSVHTGSWEDFPESPGIAHFLEHMLFLGTKKYPKESEFEMFLADHGGEANALTSSDWTLFMFTVGNPAFPEAIDRFASIFKEPLFNPSGVDREVHAIDEEFAKNIQDSRFRELHVLKELADPHHPFSRFSIGNSLSLTNISRDTLVEWHRQHYSANLMKLIVYSSLPLETMTTLVSTRFEGVANTSRKPFRAEVPIASDASLGKMVYIAPIKNQKTLSIIWDLPSRFSQMEDSKPHEIICEILGNEGKGSLLARLKKEKLAAGLEAGYERVAANALRMRLDIGLTDEGLKQRHAVINRVFQTIAMLKSQEVPSYIFHDIQTMETVNYQYQEKNTVFDRLKSLGIKIADEPLESFPERSFILQKYDPAGISEFLDCLTPFKAIYIIQAPPSDSGVDPGRKEKWTGTEYTFQPIPEKLLNEWSDAPADQQAELFPPNPFIPKVLKLSGLASPPDLSQDRMLPLPNRILDSDRGRVYYCPDLRFKLPKISWHLLIKTPQIDFGVPSKTVSADLYVKALNECLDSTLYPASKAGIDCTIQREDFGISIHLEGYSENASLLLKKVLKELKSPLIDEEKFKAYKETLLDEYGNRSFAPPIAQASDLLKAVLHKRFASSKAKAAAIKKLSFESYREFTAQLFKRTYVEAVLYGNMTEREAKGIQEMVLGSLSALPYPRKNQQKYAIIDFPAGKGPFYLESKVKAPGNAALLAIQCDDCSFKGRAAQQILMEALKEPFFSELRTKQQTGYLVDSEAKEVEGRLFCLFHDQSQNRDPRDLLARFELFIEGYLEDIPGQHLPEERYRMIQDSFIEKFTRFPNGFHQTANALALAAFKHEGDFDILQKRLEGFKQLSYSEFIDFAQKQLGRENKQRLALLLYGSQAGGQEFRYYPLRGLAELRKLSSYTREGALTHVQPL